MANIKKTDEEARRIIVRVGLDDAAVRLFSDLHSDEEFTIPSRKPHEPVQFRFDKSNRTLAASGDTQKGLAILDKLDKHFEK